MKTINADVMVHIKDDLPLNDMKEVADSIGKIDGVENSEVSVKSHLLKVDFDSELVNTQNIIEKVRQQGLDASLVGL